MITFTGFLRSTKSIKGDQLMEWYWWALIILFIIYVIKTM